MGEMANSPRVASDAHVRACKVLGNVDLTNDRGLASTPMNSDCAKLTVARVDSIAPRTSREKHCTSCSSCRPGESMFTATRVVTIGSTANDAHRSAVMIGDDYFMPVSNRRQPHTSSLTCSVI